MLVCLWFGNIDYFILSWCFLFELIIWMLNFCGLRDLVKVVFLNLFKKKKRRICDVVEVYVCLMIKF